MDILRLKDERVELIIEAEGLPQVGEFRKSIMSRKKFFDDCMRFIYYMYSRNSVFRDILPKEREEKIMDTFFPKRTSVDFTRSDGFNKFVEWYLDFTKSYKERMYENHLSDIEEMAINISKISFTKKKKILRTVNVKVGKEYMDVDIDTEIIVDNTEEKLKAMDLMTRLIEKEEFLKKKITEEYIKGTKKGMERRLFDITTKN